MVGPGQLKRGVWGREFREGHGDFVGYRVWFGPLHPKNISGPLPVVVQRNNRADLTACIEALQAVPLVQPLPVNLSMME